MAAVDVDLKLDEPRRIRFAHSPLKAFLFSLIAAGFVALCWTAMRDETVARYGFTAFASLFLLAGVAGIFWRLEVDIDLAGRRVRIRRGLWPNAKTRERSLDEAEGVWLTLDYRSSGSKKNKRKVPWWFVSLKFPDEKRGTRVFATRNEVDGYKKWEYYAERLGLDAVDATSGEPRRTAPRDLDANLESKARASGAATASAPAKPAASAIEIVWSSHGREIMLPRPGFNGGLVFLCLFGGVFAALGGGAFLANLGVIDVAVSGSRTALAIVPPVFVLAGFFIVWLGVKGSFSSHAIGVKDAALYIETLAFGRRSAQRSVPLGRIESIAVGGDVRARRRRGGRIRAGSIGIGRHGYRKRENEVVIRSDETILRFGASLSDEDKAWLAEACRYATVHGRLP